MIQTVKLQYVSFRDYSNSEYGFGIETSLGQQKLGVLVSFSDINNNNLAYISELGYFSIFGKARQYFEGNKFNKDGFFGELNAAYIMMRDKNNAGFNGYDFGGALGYSMIIDKKWIFEPNIFITFTSLTQGVVSGQTGNLNKGLSGLNYGLAMDTTFNF